MHTSLCGVSLTRTINQIQKYSLLKVVKTLAFLTPNPMLLKKSGQLVSIYITVPLTMLHIYINIYMLCYADVVVRARVDVCACICVYMTTFRCVVAFFAGNVLLFIMKMSLLS